MLTKYLDLISGSAVHSKHPVIEKIHHRLTPLLGIMNNETLKAVDYIESDIFPAEMNLHQKRDFIRQAAHRFPQESFDFSRVLTSIPPSEIHNMQRTDHYWIGDLFSANMILTILGDQGRDECSLSILDVGCSSGALVRMLAAYEPTWDVYGVDPIESAISWADKNVPTGTFKHMDNVPPLELPDQSFDGATAISVWSHHSPEAARVWFKEVARILRPNGWFIPTFSTLHHIRWLANKSANGQKLAEEIISSISSKGFHFIPVNYSAEKNSTDETWGQMTYSRELFYKIASEFFVVDGFYPGINQGNQDAAFLVKREGLKDV